MLFAVLLMASCNNEGSMISMPKDEMVAVSTVKVVDGNILPVSREDNATADIALAFASQKCLDEFMSTLNDMTKDERLTVVHSFGVETLYDLAVFADNELDSIGEKAASEAEFNELYSNYVEKYDGLLVRDESDVLDLSLYVPNADDVHSYICNPHGLYVVGNKIIKPNLIRTNSQQIRPLAVDNASGINSVVFQPASGKRVSFSLNRWNEYVHLKTKFQKKMWYGWKGDSNHEIAYEFYVGTGSIAASPANKPRTYIINKSDFEADIMQYPIDKYLQGEVYIWTDYSYERDANGNVIMEVIANINQPKCVRSKAVVINVGLSKDGTK